MTVKFEQLFHRPATRHLNITKNINVARKPKWAESFRDHLKASCSCLCEHGKGGCSPPIKSKERETEFIERLETVLKRVAGVIFITIMILRPNTITYFLKSYCKASPSISHFKITSLNAANIGRQKFLQKGSFTNHVTRIKLTSLPHLTTCWRLAYFSALKNTGIVIKTSVYM